MDVDRFFIVLCLKIIKNNQSLIVSSGSDSPIGIGSPKKTVNKKIRK